MKTLPGGVALWFGPFVILGVTGILLYRNWERLPERFPVHWGIHGPDRWVQTTPQNLTGMLLGGAVLCALMMVMALLSARDRVASTGRPAIFILLGAEYLLALAFSLLPLSTLYPVNVGLILLCLSILFVIATITLSIRAAGKPTDDTALSSSPEHWHWGLFYYNPRDPEVIVEKRFGFGYTFNMARPVAWLLTGGLILVPIVLIRFLR